MPATLRTADPSTSPERVLWLPPRRLRRYELGKWTGGGLFATIFLLWMCVLWSNALMRFVAAALVLLTTWVTVASTISDRRRATGRQVRLEADTLSVTTPEGTTIVPLTDVSEAQWRSGAVGETGLWLLGHDGRVLAHLDASFLAGEDEARAFVGWARQRAVLPFNVRWPSADAAK